MVELYDFAFRPSGIAIPWSETATPKKAQIWNTVGAPTDFYKVEICYAFSIFFFYLCQVSDYVLLYIL